MSLEIKTNAADIQRAMLEFPRQFVKGLKKVLTAKGNLIVKGLKIYAFSGRPRLFKHSQNLQKGLNYELTEDGAGLRIYNTEKYSRIQEYGGTITAKGKMLSIPLAAALYPTGIARWPGPTQTSYAKTFVKKSKAGALIIWGVKGKDIIPLYVLKNRVEIPARFGVREDVEDALPSLAEEIGDMAVALWGRGSAGGAHA
jgi:hypothetical protein